MGMGNQKDQDAHDSQEEPKARRKHEQTLKSPRLLPKQRRKRLVGYIRFKPDVERGIEIGAYNFEPESLAGLERKSILIVAIL